MSTATRKLNYATIGNYDITAGQTVTVGFAVTMDSAGVGTPPTVRNAAAGVDNDLIIGVAHTGGTSTVAGDANVDVFLFAPVVPVTVGPGGSAAVGSKAIWNATGDGFTVASALVPAGANDEQSYGVFVQDGNAGDIVGMMLGMTYRQIT
jgi:hypothetical protein